jgi:hypothetical protein
MTLCPPIFKSFVPSTKACAIKDFAVIKLHIGMATEKNTFGVCSFEPVALSL